MTSATPDGTTRRDFLAGSGRVAAASALAGIALPQVHHGSDETIQVALVGCGGRGGGAAVNALSVPDGNLKVIALADVFEERTERAVKLLTERFPDTALEIQGLVHNHLAQAYEENQDNDKAIAESKATVGYFDRIVQAASERGLTTNEPAWVAEAKARIARLESAS